MNFQVNMEIYRELKIGGSKNWPAEAVKRTHSIKFVICRSQDILRKV